MAITKAFTDAVASGDIRGIRIMMKDSLLVDLTSHDFNEMSRLAAKVSGLYDAHDGRMFIEDSSAWNDDYMNKLMVQVVGNFSHECLSHLKEVVRYLRPIPECQDTARKSYYEARERHQCKTQKAKDAKSRIVKIAGGVVAGGVIGGVGAAFAGTATGIYVVVGAVVGGGIATLTIYKRRVVDE